MIGLCNIVNALHGAQQRRQPKTSNLVYLYTDTGNMYTQRCFGANLFHVIRTRTYCVCVCILELEIAVLGSSPSLFLSLYLLLCYQTCKLVNGHTKKKEKKKKKNIFIFSVSPSRMAVYF